MATHRSIRPAHLAYSDEHIELAQLLISDFLCVRRGVKTRLTIWRSHHLGVMLAALRLQSKQFFSSKNNAEQCRAIVCRQGKV